MKILNYFLIILLLLPTILFGVNDIAWSNHYGGTGDDFLFQSFFSDHTDLHIFVGYTYAFGAGGSDVMMLRADTGGAAFVDTNYYGTAANERGVSICENFDSTYLILGTTYSGSDIDIYYIRTDTAGDTIKTCGLGGTADDIGTQIILNPCDSAALCLGYTTSYGAGEQDIYLIKLDTAGDTLWTQTYGDTNYEYAWDIVSTYDSGFVIVGEQFFYGASNIYIMKVDSVGDTLWTRTYGDTISSDYAYSVFETLDSCYVFTGKYDTSVFLYKIDATGSIVFQKYYSSPHQGVGRSVTQAYSDSGFMICGYTEWTIDSGNIMYLIRTDKDGDTILTRTFGGLYTDYGFDIMQVYFDSTYIISGVRNLGLSSSVFDGYIFKYEE